MSSAYSFVPTNRPTGITIPSDGDAPIKAADVNPAFQALGDLAANAIARVEPIASLAALAAIAGPTNLMTRLVVGYGFYTFLTASPLAGYLEPRGVAATDATPGTWVSHRALYDFEASAGTSIAHPPRDIIGISPLIAFNATRDSLDEAGASVQITRYATGVAFTNVNSASTDSRQLYFDITPRLLHGAYLASVFVGLAPVVHASVPARPPRMIVFRHHLKTWNAAQESLYGVGYYEDTGHANGAAYSAVHKFGGAMDQNHMIDRTNYAYTLAVVNEAHTNSLGGLIITHFEFTHT